MATYLHTFTSGDTLTPTKLNNARTATDIVNADISASAAIAATKLASDSITNTQIKSDAAIAGSKIAPAFGNQDITSSGIGRTISVGSTSGGNNAVRVFSASGSLGLALQTATDVSIASNSEILFKTGANIEAAPGTSVGGTERMRISSNGTILIGKTTENQALAGIQLGASGEMRVTRTDGEPLAFFNRPNDGTLLIFRRNAETKGSITISTTAVAFNTTSDYRLKENPSLLTDALATVNQLKPVQFTWKTDGSVGQGFIAHEVQAVVPQAVTGEKDGEDMQGLDHSKLVPVLVAALQELAAKVAALEAA
jgi:hypothetical protein